MWNLNSTVWDMLSFHPWPSRLLMMFLSQRRADVKLKLHSEASLWFTYFILPLCIMKNPTLGVSTMLYKADGLLRLLRYPGLISVSSNLPRHGHQQLLGGSSSCPSCSNSAGTANPQTGTSTALSSSPFAGKDLISRSLCVGFKSS